MIVDIGSRRVCQTIGIEFNQCLPPGNCGITFTSTNNKLAVDSEQLDERVDIVAPHTVATALKVGDTAEWR